MLPINLMASIRAWQQRSLGHSFIFSAASLVLTSVLLIAAISVAILYWLERRAEQAELHHKGQVAAERVLDPIQVMAQALLELSRSAMFTTALLDSSDRAAYARPYLQSYSFPVPVANGLALCDINGSLLAGTRTLADCQANSAEYAQVLADGKTRQVLSKSADGRRLWTIFQGIPFIYTGSIEGVAVAQLELDALLTALPAQLDLAAVELRPKLALSDVRQTGSYTNWLNRHDSLVVPLFSESSNGMSSSLKIDTALNLSRLELVLDSHPSSVWEKLLPLLAGYLIASLALLVAVLYWARQRSRVLIDPLLALRDRAQAIASSGDLTLSIPKSGVDEVGQLADSIEHMVREIRVAETTRREAEARFRLMFETSREAIIFAWPDGRIETANAAALVLFGYSQDEFGALGRTGVMDVTDPALKPALEQRARNGSFSGELRCIRKDGRVFPVDIVSTIFQDAQGVARSTNMFRDITERQENTRRLKAMSQRLVEVQESARRHLASELHDRTSANLAALGINLAVSDIALQSQDWSAMAERISDNRALMEDTVASIREICAELRPPALDYAGLSAAIESYVNQYSRRTNIQVELNCDLQQTRFSPNVESTMFRIVQEALTNVLKHAEATWVKLDLSLDEHTLRLRVSDNGQGFALDNLKNAQGLGIINMREMVELSSGRFELESQTGQGAQIRVELPAKEAA